MIAVYRLLRNFCISFNTIYQSKKEEDRQEVPKKYVKEVETILATKVNFDKFQKALKAENVDNSIKELPDSLNEASITALVDFIGKHD